MILSTGFTRPEVTILGICSTALTALSFVLLEQLLYRTNKEHRGSNGTLGIGTSGRRLWPAIALDEDTKVMIRDVTGAVSITCFLASFVIESYHIDSLANRPPMNRPQLWNEGWRNQLFLHNVGRDVRGFVIELIKCLCMFAMVSDCFSSATARHLLVHVAS